MENQLSESLTPNDQELVEATARALDHRPIENGPQLWKYLCSLNIKGILLRRGVLVSSMTKKGRRTFRRKAARYIADFTSRDHALFPSMQTDITTRATLIHSFLLIFMERQIHRGILRTRHGEPVSALCTDTQCKLGCPQVLADKLGAEPAQYSLQAKVEVCRAWPLKARSFPL